MIKYFRRTILILFSIFVAGKASAGFLPDTAIVEPGVALKVVIIRHGEKPDSGDNLSCAGFNRSLKLPAVLDTITGRPDYTFVPTISNGKKTNNVRMFQTITPFAVKDSLVINTKFPVDSFNALANYVLDRVNKKDTQMVLIVWEHNHIDSIALSLGVPENLVHKWKSSDFDSIWIMTFDKKKKFMAFWKEKEHIKPQDTCQ